MGCDIHIVLERRAAGTSEWVGLWSSDRVPFPRRPMAATRDYGFFTEIAQVRGSSSTGLHPRNLPADVSRLAWLEYIRHPTDHHSVSHVTPAEFVDAWRRANPGDYAEVRAAHAAYDLLHIDTDFAGDHRLVFWFDN